MADLAMDNRALTRCGACARRGADGRRLNLPAIIAVSEQQTKIIEVLQTQVDKMEAAAYGGHSTTAPNG